MTLQHKPIRYDEQEPHWRGMAHLLAFVLLSHIPKVDIAALGVCRRGFWVDLFDVDKITQEQLTVFERALCELSQRHHVESIDIQVGSLRGLLRSQGRYLRMQKLPKEDRILVSCFRYAGHIEPMDGEALCENKLPFITLLGTESIFRKEGNKTFKGVRIFGAGFSNKEERNLFRSRWALPPTEWSTIYHKDSEGNLWLDSRFYDLEQGLRSLWEKGMKEQGIGLTLNAAAAFSYPPKGLAEWGVLTLPKEQDPILEKAVLGKALIEGSLDWVIELIVKLLDYAAIKDYRIEHLPKKSLVLAQDQYGFEFELASVKEKDKGTLVATFVSSFYRWALLSSQDQKKLS